MPRAITRKKRALKKSVPRRVPAKATVSAASILTSLDDAGSEFPALVSFEWRYAGSRLHAYADRDHWAIVIEEITYGMNGHIDDFPLVLHSFGDRLPKRNQRSIWLAPVRAGSRRVFCYDKPDEDRSFHAQRLHPDANDVRIHGKLVPLSHKPRDYKKLGIKLEYAPEILKAEVQPFLVETYRDKIFATKQELGISLPKLLQLDDWFHPDITGRDSERPSDSRSFQMIANVLEHRNPALYVLTGGNTRWNQRPD